MKPTHKERAEAYVREHCKELMELSFGCEVQHKEDPDDHHFIFHCSESHPFLFVAKTDGTSGAYLDFDKREYKIIGHPIQLQHWLRVLADFNADHYQYADEDKEMLVFVGNQRLWFSLTTGQPATPEDYLVFNQIVYGN